MDVRAILIAGGGSEAQSGAESFAGYPLALLDVLGKPVVTRLAERLMQFGIERCSIVVDSKVMPPPLRRNADSKHLNWKLSRGGEDFWRTCEQTFSEFAHDGAELVLVQRVGPYLELNYEELIQFHLDNHGRVTQVLDRSGNLGTFVVSASRRNDAAFLFRHRLQECRSDCVDYAFAGYSNRLQSADDFRQIVRDALLRNNQIAPVGSEIRPGIWLGRGARVERKARLVA